MKRQKITRNGILSDMDMKQTKYKVLYWSLFGIMLFFAGVICFLPVLWIILSGFKDPQELYAVPATFFPKTIKLSKLWEVWNAMEFYKYYINTFIMAAGCTIAPLIVSGFAGYSLSKLKPKGHKLIGRIIFVFMLIPGSMSTVPLYMTFMDFTPLHFNLSNTDWPMWLMGAAGSFNIILFKNSFDGIHSEIVEAARIDGATSFKIFYKIMLPLAKPVFLVVGLFAFMGAIGNFFWPYLIINDPQMTVLGVQLYKLKQTTFTVDYQMLALLFSMIPTFVLFAIFQNKIMGGMNIGGVKG